MGFGNAILSAFEGFMVFRGRARRTEFWWFFLFILIACIASAFLELMVQTKMISIGVNVALFMPFIAVTIRRLHDTGRNFLYILILFVPIPLYYIGPEVWGLGQLFAIASMLLILCLPGNVGTNRFGSDPRVNHDLDAFR